MIAAALGLVVTSALAGCSSPGLLRGLNAGFVESTCLPHCADVALSESICIGGNDCYLRFTRAACDGAKCEAVTLDELITATVLEGPDEVISDRLVFLTGATSATGRFKTASLVKSAVIELSFDGDPVYKVTVIPTIK